MKNKILLLKFTLPNLAANSFQFSHKMPLVNKLIFDRVLQSVRTTLTYSETCVKRRYTIVKTDHSEHLRNMDFHLLYWQLILLSRSLHFCFSVQMITWHNMLHFLIMIFRWLKTHQTTWYGIRNLLPIDWSSIRTIKHLLQSMQNSLELSNHHSTCMLIYPDMKYVLWNRSALTLQQY